MVGNSFTSTSYVSLEHGRVPSGSNSGSSPWPPLPEDDLLLTLLAIASDEAISVDATEGLRRLASSASKSRNKSWDRLKDSWTAGRTPPLPS